MMTSDLTASLALLASLANKANDAVKSDVANQAVLAN
jgi:hypothetical protein